MSSLNKKQMVDLIYQQTQKIVSPRDIHNVIDVITEVILKEMDNLKPVYIRNFLTIVPKIRGGASRGNFKSKSYEFFGARKVIKIMTHPAFNKLIKKYFKNEGE